MKFIEWCDLFTIGHPKIDKEHQVLVNIINRFHNEVYKGMSRKLIDETLNLLIDYAQKHFSAEEAISEKFGFPKEMLAHHKEMHDTLIMDIFGIHEDIVSGKLSSMHELDKFLINWLIMHILVEDKKYQEYLIS